MDIRLRSIGVVKSGFKKPEELHFACEKGVLAETESEIILEEEFAEGLNGLDSFSHAWVIYLLHEGDRVEMTTHPGPPGMKGLPSVGVFASRSQYRPNHIALRLVRLDRIIGNRIFVKGLDSIDGSHVLDIKPFVPHFDRVSGERIPEWYEWHANADVKKRRRRA